MEDIKVKTIDPDFDVEKEIIEDYEKNLRGDYISRFGVYKRNTGIKYGAMLDYFIENKPKIEAQYEEVAQIYDKIINLIQDYFGDL